MVVELEEEEGDGEWVVTGRRWKEDMGLMERQGKYTKGGDYKSRIDGRRGGRGNLI